MPAHILQLDTMRLYRALTDEREDWGGKLVLLHGPECVQTGTPAAVSIAGGTTLTLDSDAVAMKAALRAGLLDFLVNSLDEALRALKNEVRQRRPLSVGLIGDVESTLAEMDERGIIPDLRLESEVFSQRRLEDERFFLPKDAAALRGIDDALAAAIPPNDSLRGRWLQRVPQFLREARSGGRWIWLSEVELAKLASQGITPVPDP